MKTQTLMDAMVELDEEIARYENSAEIDRLTGSDVAASDLDRRAHPLREARAALAKVLRPNYVLDPEIGRISIANPE